MEKLKKRIHKTCKICEFSKSLDNGEQFLINCLKGSDNVFICEDCLEEIINGESEEE